MGRCSAKHSLDLRLVVKGQSRSVTAGSYRNSSKARLIGDSWQGRALIECLGWETTRHSVKLQTCLRRRRLDCGAWGKPVSRERNNSDFG